MRQMIRGFRVQKENIPGLRTRFFAKKRTDKTITLSKYLVEFYQPLIYTILSLVKKPACF